MGGSEGKSFARLRVSTRKKLEELMEDVLEGFIGLDEDTKDIVLGPLYSKCNIGAADKILIGLLGYKAMNMVGWRDSDAVSAKELSEKLRINYNTVRANISQLAERKYVIRRGRGVYSVNVSFLDEIAKRLIKVKRKCLEEGGADSYD